ncbi:MAG: alpha/beta fold hydrolase [Roseiflexaceae bacterium]
MREPLVYTQDGLRIFGVLHRPAAPASRLLPGVVLYHGFMAAKFQPPHRIFVQLSEALARAGVVSLRIDLPGRGDSEGESIDITPAGDLAAAQGALDLLAAQPGVDGGWIGLVGMSWGGILAALLAGRDTRVACTALWSCVPAETLDWRPDLRDIGGRRVAEFVGNLVGEQFYAGLAQLRPLDELCRTRAPVLLLHGTRDPETPPEAVAHAQTRLAAAGVAVQVTPLEGADHVFFKPDWQRQAVEATMGWLCERLTSN